MNMYKENSVSCVKNVKEMVGKRVCHLSSDGRGKTQWFNGTVMEWISNIIFLRFF